MSLSRPADNGQTREWPTWQEIVRLVIVLLAAVLLQAVIAPHLRVLGANPDFILIAMVCVALLMGAEVGAVFGFLAGVMGAVALVEPLGLSAFVLVLVGFFAGRYAETADLPSGMAPILVVFATTLIANLLFAAAQFLLAREVPLGFFAGRVLAPALVFNTLLAAPSYIVVQAWLRRAGDRRAVARS
jgi:rod shape-determining protein MreD